MSERDEGSEERILVLAPFGRDAQLTCDVLVRAGLLCTPCQDAEDLGRQIEQGAAAALLTEEVLTPATITSLITLLERQPPWSDLPLVFLVRTERHIREMQQAVQVLGPGSNVTVLKRPVPIPTLITIMQSAVRARRRQYEVRQVQQHLEKRVEERTAELAYVNATLVEQVEERERVEERLKQRNRELITLNMVTAAVTSSLELPQVLETLKALLIEEFNIPGGAIFFYDEFTEHLELRASWNLPPNVLSAFEFRSVDGSHLERVVRRQEILFWSDFREVDQLRRLGLDAARPTWQSHLCVPLRAKGKIQGVLDLFSLAPTVFTKEHAVFFLTLGRQVGVAIQNARLFDEVVTKRERLRQLTQQVVEAQEEERRRISRELHDEAGQALTALKISLNLTRAILPAELAKARRTMTEAAALADETMERIRLLAQDLRPPALDHIGLNGTLEGLCRDFARRTQLSIKYRGANLPPIPGSVAIALYRVVQEALTNVGRHADASEVRVTLDYDADTIELSIWDDGRGFDVYTSMNGIGISGMRERIELFGGRLEIDTAPGQGTNVVATLRWPDNDE